MRKPEPELQQSLAVPFEEAPDPTPWVGSRWWRCDLHVHSRASHDSTARPEDIVAAAAHAGLDAIAITDHNTGKEIDAFAALKNCPVVVFPGVELTTSEGAHLLVVFDRDATTAEVTTFLGRCNVDAGAQGTQVARSTFTYEQCMNFAHDSDAVCIAAHADLVSANDRPSSGLLEVLQRGNGLQSVLANECLHAVELCTDDEQKRLRLCRSLDGDAERRPWLRGSDAHAAAEVGRASTWIKMTAPTLEGLRLAFADGQRSVHAHDGQDPNRLRPAKRIEAIEIAGAKLLGRNEPFRLGFNPWLNAIIGGRSTGKSSVIEMLRLALDRGGDLPKEFQASFQDFAQVGSSDKLGMLLDETSIVVTYLKDDARFRVTWQNATHTIERESPGGVWEPAEGDVAQRFPAQIFSQKQVFALADGSEALLRVIDAAPGVAYATWAEEHVELKARYLSECADTRAIETRLADRGRLRGQLDDIERKIESSKTVTTALFCVSTHDANNKRSRLRISTNRCRASQIVSKRRQQLSMLHFALSHLMSATATKKRCCPRPARNNSTCRASGSN